MKNHHSGIKREINESLSDSVKQLQQEVALQSDKEVTSDSVSAQQFTSIVEAAFVHGLKRNYYEKRKHNKDLPKPQFWNLICKISHKDSIQETKKLKLITTSIGRCRGWLRLSLNNGDLLSYLTSLMTSEYKSLLMQYYDNYALFNDPEQADILLRYLHGVDNLVFNLGCNSTILNYWTKTPLQLAGVIPLTRRTNNNYMTSQSPSMSMNQSQKSILRRGSLLERNHTSMTSQVISSSLPSGHTDEDPSQLVEVHPDFGEIPVARKETAVLHRRHLGKKRKSRSLRAMSEDYGSWGSISSFSSDFSTHSVPLRMGNPRGTSLSSGENSPEEIPESPVTPLSPLTPSISDPPLTPTNGTSVTPTNGTSVTPTNGTSVTPTNGTLVTHRNPEPHISTDPPPLLHHNPHPTNSTRLSGEFPQLTQKEPCLNGKSPSNTIDPVNPGEAPAGPQTDPFEPHMEFPMITPTKTPSAREIPLDPEDPMIISTSTLCSENRDEPVTFDPVTFDPVDIYARRVSSDCLVCSPMSPGNSLLCGGGWSSSHASDVTIDDVTTDDVTAEPIVNPPTSETIMEGYLQKRGDSLLLSRSRWFLLNQHSLKYYKGKNKKQLLGEIRLDEIDNLAQTDDKTFIVTMCNGTQHTMASEKKESLSDWVGKINSFLTLVKVDDTKVDGFELIMEGDLERNNHILGDRWESMMSGHMTRIANEKGLDAQNFRCADCTSPIGIFYGAPRLCWYTGEYYCQNCHLMEENMIPARIIHNWDFRKHKVSKRTMVYLTQQWRDPCIQMDEVNPSGYRYIDELKKLLPLRLQLATLEPYLQTCRMLTPELLSTRLKGLHHMLGNPHIYSPHDLCLVRDGLLYNAINKLVQFGIKHVRQCALCTAKGFVCEICGKDEIIFAFDDMTSQCQQCKGVFHKRCFADRCPRCERRHNRNTPL